MQTDVHARFIEVDGTITTQPARPVYDADGELVAYEPLPDACELHPDADLHDAETGELIRRATRAEVEAVDAEGWWPHEGDSVRSNLELYAGRSGPGRLCYVVLADTREP